MIILRCFCVLYGPCGPSSTSGGRVNFTLKGCSERVMVHSVHSLARNVCCSLELGVMNPGVIPATLTTMAVVRTENRGVWSLPAKLKGLWMVSFNPDSATRGPRLLAGFLPQFCSHAKEPVAGPGGTREGNG